MSVLCFQNSSSVKSEVWCSALIQDCPIFGNNYLRTDKDMAKRRVALTPLCSTLKTIRKTGGTLRCCLAKRGREYPKDSSDAKEIKYCWYLSCVTIPHWKGLWNTRMRSRGLFQAAQNCISLSFKEGLSWETAHGHGSALLLNTVLVVFDLCLPLKNARTLIGSRLPS